MFFVNKSAADLNKFITKIRKIQIIYYRQLPNHFPTDLNNQPANQSYFNVRKT